MIVESRLESDGTLVLTIMAKTLTSTDAAEFRETAKSAIVSSAGRVAVDCSQLEFIDSSGVGALLHVNNLLPEARRPVRLTKVGPKVLATLELMRVHRQFELDPGT
jgi:anti-sigma B factor antagonist